MKNLLADRRLLDRLWAGIVENPHLAELGRGHPGEPGVAGTAREAIRS
jgi:hypothetical protein